MQQARQISSSKAKKLIIDSSCVVPSYIESLNKSYLDFTIYLYLYHLLTLSLLPYWSILYQFPYWLPPPPLALPHSHSKVILLNNKSVHRQFSAQNCWLLIRRSKNPESLSIRPSVIWLSIMSVTLSPSLHSPLISNWPHTSFSNWPELCIALVVLQLFPTIFVWLTSSPLSVLCSNDPSSKIHPFLACAVKQGPCSPLTSYFICFHNTYQHLMYVCLFAASFTGV